MGVNEFIKAYGEIIKADEKYVRTVLEIQNKQDTRYSRVKTCMELWNHQQTKIDQLKKQLEEK